MRTQLAEDVRGVHESSGGNVGIGRLESSVQQGAVILVEPVARVER